MIKSEILAQLVRGGFVDLIHYGSLVVTDKDGKVIYSIGDADRPAFLRSSAKPLQAITTVESGALEKFNINDNEVAIMCGSHFGQDIHVQTVKSILGKIGLTEDALQCSATDPARDNCSGKHSGILTLCKFYDFPVDTYLEPDHPAQVMIRKVMGEMCDVGEVKYGIDGCGVPTFYMPLRNMAIGFARMANTDGMPSNRSKAIKRIVSAMQSHPLMTGEIRSGKTWPKQIVAKGGAHGVYCGGIIEQNKGIAVKIDDGNHSVCGLVFTEVIQRLKLADAEELDEYRKLASTIEKNRRGDIVAELKIAF